MAKHKRLKPIREHLFDKGEMIEQMFSSIPIVEVRNMVPIKLQGMPLHELKAECLVELLEMSDREIMSILEGKKTRDPSSSESEAGGVVVISDDEKRIKKERRSDPHPTVVRTEDSDDTSTEQSTSSKKKNKRKSKEEDDPKGRKKKKVDSRQPVPSSSRDGQTSKEIPKKKKGAKPPEKPKPSAQDVVVLDDISSEESGNEGGKKSGEKSLLDLLELEMRARAIRSLLKKEEETQAKKVLSEYKDEPDDLIPVEVVPPQVDLLSDSDEDLEKEETVGQPSTSSGVQIEVVGDTLSSKDSGVLDTLLRMENKGFSDVVEMIEVDDASIDFVGVNPPVTDGVTCKDVGSKYSSTVNTMNKIEKSKSDTEPVKKTNSHPIKNCNKDCGVTIKVERESSDDPNERQKIEHHVVKATPILAKPLGVILIQNQSAQIAKSSTKSSNVGVHTLKPSASSQKEIVESKNRSSKELPPLLEKEQSNLLVQVCELSVVHPDYRVEKNNIATVVNNDEPMKEMQSSSTKGEVVVAANEVDLEQNSRIISTSPKQFTLLSKIRESSTPMNIENILKENVVLPSVSQLEDDTLVGTVSGSVEEASDIVGEISYSKSSGASSLIEPSVLPVECSKPQSVSAGDDYHSNFEEDILDYDYDPSFNNAAKQSLHCVATGASYPRSSPLRGPQTDKSETVEDEDDFIKNSEESDIKHEQFMFGKGEAAESLQAEMVILRALDKTLISSGATQDSNLSLTENNFNTSNNGEQLGLVDDQVSGLCRHLVDGSTIETETAGHHSGELSSDVPNTMSGDRCGPSGGSKNIILTPYANEEVALGISDSEYSDCVQSAENGANLDAGNKLSSSDLCVDVHLANPSEEHSRFLVNDALGTLEAVSLISAIKSQEHNETGEKLDSIDYQVSGICGYLVDGSTIETETAGHHSGELSSDIPNIMSGGGSGPSGGSKNIILTPYANEEVELDISDSEYSDCIQSAENGANLDAGNKLRSSDLCVDVHLANPSEEHNRFLVNDALGTLEAVSPISAIKSQEHNETGEKLDSINDQVSGLCGHLVNVSIIETETASHHSELSGDMRHSILGSHGPAGVSNNMMLTPYANEEVELVFSDSIQPAELGISYQEKSGATLVVENESNSSALVGDHIVNPSEEHNHFLVNDALGPPDAISPRSTVKRQEHNETDSFMITLEGKMDGEAAANIDQDYHGKLSSQEKNSRSSDHESPDPLDVESPKIVTERQELHKSDEHCFSGEDSITQLEQEAIIDALVDKEQLDCVVYDALGSPEARSPRSTMKSQELNETDSSMNSQQGQMDREAAAHLNQDHHHMLSLEEEQRTPSDHESQDSSDVLSPKIVTERQELHDSSVEENEHCFLVESGTTQSEQGASKDVLVDKEQLGFLVNDALGSPEAVSSRSTMKSREHSETDSSMNSQQGQMDGEFAPHLDQEHHGKLSGQEQNSRPSNHESPSSSDVQSPKIVTERQELHDSSVEENKQCFLVESGTRQSEQGASKDALVDKEQLSFLVNDALGSPEAVSPRSTMKSRERNETDSSMNSQQAQMDGEVVPHLDQDHHGKLSSQEENIRPSDHESPDSLDVESPEILSKRQERYNSDEHCFSDEGGTTQSEQVASKDVLVEKEQLGFSVMDTLGSPEALSSRSTMKSQERNETDSSMNSQQGQMDGETAAHLDQDHHHKLSLEEEQRTPSDHESADSSDVQSPKIVTERQELHDSSVEENEHCFLVESGTTQSEQGASKDVLVDKEQLGFLVNYGLGSPEAVSPRSTVKSQEPHETDSSVNSQQGQMYVEAAAHVDQDYFDELSSQEENSRPSDHESPDPLDVESPIIVAETQELHSSSSVEENEHCFLEEGSPTESKQRPRLSILVDKEQLNCLVDPLDYSVIPNHSSPEELNASFRAQEDHDSSDEEVHIERKIAERLSNNEDQHFLVDEALDSLDGEEPETWAVIQEQNEFSSFDVEDDVFKEGDTPVYNQNTKACSEGGERGDREPETPERLSDNEERILANKAIALLESRSEIRNQELLHYKVENKIVLLEDKDVTVPVLSKENTSKEVEKHYFLVHEALGSPYVTLLNTNMENQGQNEHSVTERNIQPCSDCETTAFVGCNSIETQKKIQITDGHAVRQTVGIYQEELSGKRFTHKLIDNAYIMDCIVVSSEDEVELDGATGNKEHLDESIDCSFKNNPCIKNQLCPACDATQPYSQCESHKQSIHQDSPINQGSNFSCDVIISSDEHTFHETELIKETPSHQGDHCPEFAPFSGTNASSLEPTQPSLTVKERTDVLGDGSNNSEVNEINKHASGDRRGEEEQTSHGIECCEETGLSCPPSAPSSTTKSSRFEPKHFIAEVRIDELGTGNDNSEVIEIDDEDSSGSGSEEEQTPQGTKCLEETSPQGDICPLYAPPSTTKASSVETDILGNGNNNSQVIEIDDDVSDDSSSDKEQESDATSEDSHQSDEGSCFTIYSISDDEDSVRTRPNQHVLCSSEKSKFETKGITGEVVEPSNEQSCTAISAAMQSVIQRVVLPSSEGLLRTVTTTAHRQIVDGVIDISDSESEDTPRADSLIKQVAACCDKELESVTSNDDDQEIVWLCTSALTQNVDGNVSDETCNVSSEPITASCNDDIHTLQMVNVHGTDINELQGNNTGKGLALLEKELEEGEIEEIDGVVETSEDEGSPNSKFFNPSETSVAQQHSHKRIPLSTTDSDSSVDFFCRSRVKIRSKLRKKRRKVIHEQGKIQSTKRNSGESKDKDLSKDSPAATTEGVPQITSNVSKQTSGTMANFDTIIIEDDDEEIVQAITEKIPPEILELDDSETKTNWTARWLESSHVKKVVTTSKILTNARKKLKMKLKVKEIPEIEAAPLLVEVPQLIGSVEEYHRLVKEGVITSSSKLVVATGLEKVDAAGNSDATPNINVPHDATTDKRSDDNVGRANSSKEVPIKTSENESACDPVVRADQPCEKLATLEKELEEGEIEESHSFVQISSTDPVSLVKLNRPTTQPVLNVESSTVIVTKDGEGEVKNSVLLNESMKGSTKKTEEDGKCRESLSRETSAVGESSIEVSYPQPPDTETSILEENENKSSVPVITDPLSSSIKSFYEMMNPNQVIGNDSSSKSLFDISFPPKNLRKCNRSVSIQLSTSPSAVCSTIARAAESDDVGSTNQSIDPPHITCGTTGDNTSNALESKKVSAASGLVLQLTLDKELEEGEIEYSDDEIVTAGLVEISDCATAAVGIQNTVHMSNNNVADNSSAIVQQPAAISTTTSVGNTNLECSCGKVSTQPSGSTSSSAYCNSSTISPIVPTANVTVHNQYTPAPVVGSLPSLSTSSSQIIGQPTAFVQCSNTPGSSNTVHSTHSVSTISHSTLSSVIPPSYTIPEGQTTPLMVNSALQNPAFSGVHAALPPMNLIQAATAGVSNLNQYGGPPSGFAHPHMSVNVNSTLHMYDPYYSWVYSQGLSGSLNSGYGAPDPFQGAGAIYKQWGEYYRKLMEACQDSAARASASNMFRPIPPNSVDSQGYSWVFERPNQAPLLMNNPETSNIVLKNVEPVQNQGPGGEWNYRYGLKGLLNEHFVTPGTAPGPSATSNPLRGGLSHRRPSRRGKRKKKR